MRPIAICVLGGALFGLIAGFTSMSDHLYGELSILVIAVLVLASLALPEVRRSKTG